jgi:2',5'-phosphodiesterase
LKVSSIWARSHTDLGLARQLELTSVLYRNSYYELYL